MKENRRYFAFAPGDGWLYLFEKLEEEETDEAGERMIRAILAHEIDPIDRVPHPETAPERVH